MSYTYKVIYIITFMLIIFLTYKGDSQMGDATIAAIIGGAAMLLIDILTNIRATKSNKIKIEHLSEQVKKGFGSISKRIDNNYNTISDEMGTKTRDRKSLSSQHEDMVDLIKSKSKEQSGMFADQMNIIKEINDREKAEIHRNKQIENSLSQQTIEAKQISDSFAYLTRRVEKLEYSLKESEEASAKKSGKIRRLEGEIIELEQKLSVYEAERSKPIERPKRKGPSL